jgi:hypothetical protein
MRVFTTLYLIFFIFSLSAITWHTEAPDNFSFNVNIPHSHVSLGDTFEVDVKITYPDTYTFDEEKLKSHLLSHNTFKAAPFTLISSTTNTDKVDSIITQNIQFRLQSQVNGLFYLSFYSIHFDPRNSTDKPVVLISNLFEIKVDQPNIDRTIPLVSRNVLLPLSDSPPIEMDENNRNMLLVNPKSQIAEAQRNIEIANKSTLPWPEIVLTVITLLFFIMVHISPPRKPQIKSPQQIILKAREKALKSLENIKIRKPKPEQFYVELTETIRNYIEEQYQINTVTHTTEEFLQEATHYSEFSQKMKEELKQFLIKADIVKFAKHAPSLNECEQAEQAAKRVIQQEQ